MVLRQGNHYKTVTGVDCSGEEQTVTDLVCTLTAQFPGVTIVSGEVKDGSGSSLVTCGSKTDSAVFTVLRGENYQVVLRQGNHYKTVTGVDCSGETQTVTDLVCTLTVKFPGITIVSGQVQDASGSSIVSCGAKTDSVQFVVLRGSGYKVILRVGNKYYTYTGIDCSGGTATVDKTRLTVNYPGVRSVNRVQVFKNGSNAGYHDWTSETTSFDLGAGTYDIRVTKGGMVYEFHDVFLLGGDVTANVPILDLVVNYPGVSSVNRVQVKQNGSNVEYHDWTSETTSFKVFDNGTDYTVWLQKGGMEYTGSVTCADPVLDVPILDLVVNYPGVTSVNRVQVKQNGSNVEYHDWTSNTTSFKVFDNGTDYTVWLQKGGMEYTGSVTCADPVLDVPILDLIVNYPNVKSVNRVQVLQGGSNVEYHDWTSDTTSFKVFDNGTDYTVWLQKGGMTYTGSVTCADPVLDVPITYLQILYPGITGMNRVQVKQNGSNVEYHDWTSGSTGFYLFQSADPYQVILTKGSGTYTYNSVICDAPSVIVDKAGVVLETGGIRADYVQFKQGGTTKYTFYGVNSGSKFTVLNGIYDIVYVKGGMVIQQSGVICLGDEMTQTVATKVLTFEFPGIKPDYVRLSQGGSAVYTVYGPENSVSFTVYDNGLPYDATLVKGGMSIAVSGSAGETVPVPVDTITVNFPGIKADYVTLSQGGGIYTAYGSDGSQVFTVFDNGAEYTALAVKGGMSASGTGFAGGAIDLSVDTITVNFPGIKADYVTLSQSGGIYTAYGSDGSQVFTVFDNGAEYTALAVKGGMSASGNGYAGGAIDLSVDTITVNFPGIKADYVTLSQSGGIYTAYGSDGSQVFTVFDNGAEYTAQAVKGGMSASGTGYAGGAIDLAVETVTVSFDGIKADYVTLGQNGAIYTAYGSDGSQVFNVFANGADYTAQAVKGGMSMAGTGGAGETIILPTMTLTVNFPGIRADYVRLSQNGTAIYTVYGVTDTVDFLVFDNGGVYEALVVYAGGTDTVTLSKEHPTGTAFGLGATTMNAPLVLTGRLQDDPPAPTPQPSSPQPLTRGQSQYERLLTQAAPEQQLAEESVPLAAATPQEMGGFSPYWLALIIGLPALAALAVLLVHLRRRAVTR